MSILHPKISKEKFFEYNQIVLKIKKTVASTSLWIPTVT